MNKLDSIYNKSKKVRLLLIHNQNKHAQAQGNLIINRIQNLAKGQTSILALNIIDAYLDALYAVLIDPNKQNVLQFELMQRLFVKVDSFGTYIPTNKNLLPYSKATSPKYEP